MTDVAGFRKRFKGTVLEPGDAGCDESRAIWNGAIDRRPAVIAQCASPLDVADAIRFARDAGLELSVRGADTIPRGAPSSRTASR